MIEVLVPVVPEAGTYKFLQRFGAGLHHWGYACDDVEEEAARLREQGLQQIELGGPDPGSVTAAFFHPKTASSFLCDHRRGTSKRRESSWFGETRALAMQTQTASRTVRTASRGVVVFWRSSDCRLNELLRLSLPSLSSPTAFAFYRYDEAHGYRYLLLCSRSFRQDPWRRQPHRLRVPL